MLDQFSMGLQAMGVLKVIRAFPNLFISLFVYTGCVSPEDVAEAIFVDKDLYECEKQAMAHLHQFASEQSECIIIRACMFTGHFFQNSRHSSLLHWYNKISSSKVYSD